MNDLRFGVDGWIERLKKGSRRLQAADRTDDQSHDSHGFVVVLAGGGFGLLLLTCVQMVLRSYAIDVEWGTHEKLGAGMAFANAWYFADECFTRHRLGWHYKPWDFVGDWYKPACLWLPALLGSLVLAWWMIAALACWYYLFRPVD